MLILLMVFSRMSTLVLPQSRPSEAFNTFNGVPPDSRLAITTSHSPLLQVGIKPKLPPFIGALVKAWRKESSQRLVKILPSSIGLDYPHQCPVQ